MKAYIKTIRGRECHFMAIGGTIGWLATNHVGSAWGNYIHHDSMEEALKQEATDLSIMEQNADESFQAWDKKQKSI